MKILTKKVLFAGSYGLKNAGDELPLILLCENLKNNAPNINFEFTTFSRHPSKDDEIKYDIKFIKNLEYESRKESFNKSFKGFNHGDKQDDLVRVVNQIKNCDLLILGAGNIFHDKTIDLFRGPIPLIALYVYFAKVYHKKIMIYGSSVTPLKTGLGKELSSYIIENSDIITLRDEESKLELQKILSKPKTIMVLPDSTLGATKPEQDLIDKLFKREKIPLGKKYMGISLRDLNAVLPSNQTEIIWEQLIDTLNELKHKFIFIFVPQVTYKEDDDRIIAQKLCKRLDADVEFHIIKNSYDPTELIGIYSCFDLTLSIRLHGAIFSCIGGTPIIAINYLPKVGRFMESMGLTEFSIDLDSIDKKYLLELIYKLLESTEVSLKIKEVIDEKKELTNCYYKLAISLLMD